MTCGLTWNCAQPVTDQAVGRRPGAVAVGERVGQRHGLAIAVDRPSSPHMPSTRPEYDDRVLDQAPVMPIMLPAMFGMLNDTPASIAQPHVSSVVACHGSRADIVSHAADMRRAPSLLDVQRADDVGSAHAARGRRAEERRCRRRTVP